ncbi:MAG TPA: alpha/beta hydrolase, partial [Mycobacteriales bacterium]|nr:alpha/beta hydrolase [Mycobacteriales bacterium]
DGALTVLGAGPAALVGQGLGGLVALDLALRSPARCPLLVLDGLPVLSAQDRQRWADTYGTPIAPELDGSHLLRQWYRRRAELLRDPLDLTPPHTVAERLHRAVLDRLQAGDDSARPHRAAAGYDAADALQRVAVPTVHLRCGPEPVDRHAATAQALEPWRGTPAVPRHPAPARARGRWTVDFPGTPRGQVAARRFRPEGDPVARPLVVLHAAPLSGEAMLAFAQPFTAGREVVLLDTLGNGDSDRPDEPLTAADFARVALDAIAALGIERFDLYGTHTGAVLALEAALAAPERVAALVLNGVPLYTPQEAAQVWDGYFLDLTPRWDGTHLVAAWSNATDVLTWYPWHRRDPAHRRTLPALDAPSLHRRFVQMAKGGVSYCAAHRAVADHPTRERLAALCVTTAFCRLAADPLAGGLAECLSLVPAAAVLDVTGVPEQDARSITNWTATIG